MTQKNRLLILSALLACFSTTSLFSQISIKSASVNPDFISSTFFNSVTILNQSQSTVVVNLSVTVSQSGGEKILDIKAAPISLKPGLNVYTQSNFNVTSQLYSSTSEAKFLKTFRKLTSGTYNYCIQISDQGAGFNENLNDEYCDQVVSEDQFTLNLVSPFDGDEIETLNPLLVWNHSDPFNKLKPYEFYKILLTEKKTDQTNESAIRTNEVIFSLVDLTNHSINYPLNAAKLEYGKVYVWKVLKISSNNTVAETDVWSFKIKNKDNAINTKYAVLSKSPTTSTYQVNGEKFFFRFDEAYNYNGDLKINLFDDKRKMIPVSAKNDLADSDVVNIISTGYNSFELDLVKLKLKKGAYYIEVLNSKNEKYFLSFYLN